VSIKQKAHHLVQPIAVYGHNESLSTFEKDPFFLSPNYANAFLDSGTKNTVKGFLKKRTH
jgi:hypothetical protein